MSPFDVALYAPEPAPEGTPDTRGEGRPVDVLILTALQDELEAVLALGDDWSERHEGLDARSDRRAPPAPIAGRAPRRGTTTPADTRGFAAKAHPSASPGGAARHPTR